MYLSLSVLVSDTIMSWVTLSKHALRARIHRIHTHGLHKLPIVHGFHTRLVQFCQGKTELNSKLTNVNKNLLITRLGSKKKELHNTISSHCNRGCCDVVDELCVSNVGKIDVLQRKIGETRLSGTRRDEFTKT